jgi:hypothetical protein
MLVFMGCAKPDLDFSNIRIGMTKDQVVNIVGKPTRISVINNLEIFEYEAYDRVGALIVNRRSQFIRFINGKVESFGNKGDFDSTKTPTNRIELDQKLSLDKSSGPTDGKATTAPPVAFDLRAELEKLEKMKKDGLISEAEYLDLRKRALEKAKAQ